VIGTLRGSLSRVSQKKVWVLETLASPRSLVPHRHRRLVCTLRRQNLKREIASVYAGVCDRVSRKKCMQEDERVIALVEKCDATPRALPSCAL
jgi:hypothetical protein